MLQGTTREIAFFNRNTKHRRQEELISKTFILIRLKCAYLTESRILGDKPMGMPVMEFLH